MVLQGPSGLWALSWARVLGIAVFRALETLGLRAWVMMRRIQG